MFTYAKRQPLTQSELASKNTSVATRRRVKASPYFESMEPGRWSGAPASTPQSRSAQEIPQAEPSGDESEESIQRACASCPDIATEDEKLHRKVHNAAKPTLRHALGVARKAAGVPLSEASRQFMEPRFGADFGQVRVHADATAALSAQRLNALAYTRANHIFFAANKYQPDTTDGQRLIAHELAHVIQQGKSQRLGLQRQVDDENAATSGPEAAEPESPTGISDEDISFDESGSGEETDESSTDDSDLVGAEMESPEEGAPEEGAVQMKSEGPRDVDGLEHEADRAAEDVLQTRPVTISAGVASNSLVPQMKKGAKKGATKPTTPKICKRPSTRVSDWPNTYIETIKVDLTSPNHDVSLVWAGPNAATQPTGPFHSSPGAGCCDVDCSTNSHQADSDCTPTGSFTVHGHSCAMTKYPEATNVTWFGRNGIALHFYPSVPKWPASHGCVRLPQDASRIIYDNSVDAKTTVTVGGTWTRKAGVCYNCKKAKKAKKKKK